MRLFRSLSVIALGTALAACAAVLGLPDPALDESAGGGNDGGNTGVDGAGPADVVGGDDTGTVNPDGRVKTCIGSNAWSKPERINLASNLPVKIFPSLTDDELTIYWTEVLPAQGRFQVSMASRGSTDAGFGQVALALPDTSMSWESACPTATGSDLYLTRVEPTFINGDIVRYRVDGGGTTDQLGFDKASGPLRFCRTLLADAGVMYGHAELPDPQSPNGSRTTRIFRAARTGAEAWQPKDLSTELDAGDAGTFSPAVSRDELEMFYAPSGSSSPGHIVHVRRSDANAPWGPPEEIAALVTADRADAPGWLSPDGCRLYFARGVVSEAGASPSFEIFVAARTPE